MKKIKVIFQWLTAILIAFLVINVITVPFYHKALWIDLEGGASSAIYRPGSLYIQSSEGYGINKVDANGYNNASTNIDEDDFILSMGSSQTRGAQVMQGEQYTAQLNELLGGTDDNLKVYNIAQEGETFDSLAKNFGSAITDFSGAKAITLEFCVLGIDETDLETGFIPSEYKKNDYSNIQLSTTQKLKDILYTYFPYVAYLYNEYVSGYSLDLDGAFGISSSETETDGETVDMEKYAAYYDQALSYIRSCYDGEIIIIYVPSIGLDNDGMYKIIDETKELLLSMCTKYDIVTLDAYSVFYEAYQQDYTFPEGFWNTEYGSAHLNKDGHTLIANALYELLEGIE